MTIDTAKIRAAVEQTAVEPVAWVNQANLASASIERTRCGQGDTHTWSETRTTYHSVPLYTAPQPAKQEPADGAKWLHGALEDGDDTVLRVLAKAHRFAITGVGQNIGQYRALIATAIVERQAELARQPAAEPEAWYDGRKFYATPSAAHMDCADIKALRPLYEAPQAQQPVPVQEPEKLDPLTQLQVAYVMGLRDAQPRKAVKLTMHQITECHPVLYGLDDDTLAFARAIEQVVLKANGVCE